MAVFDESKVINALHKDKAEVGKKYWFSDYIVDLKIIVERGNTEGSLYELTGIDEASHLCFESSNESEWELIYPYEEPPEQRMTNRQAAEWLAKGNGERKYLSSESMGTSNCYTYLGEPDDECLSDLRIRSWDSDEWIEPTVDIYERDCK